MSPCLEYRTDDGEYCSETDAGSLVVDVFTRRPSCTESARLLCRLRVEDGELQYPFRVFSLSDLEKKLEVLPPQVRVTQ